MTFTTIVRLRLEVGKAMVNGLEDRAYTYARRLATAAVAEALETQRQAFEARRHRGLARELRRWLATHPRAWAGWPTFDALLLADREARIATLARHGCPQALQTCIEDADAIVREFRQARRERYAKAVDRARVDGDGRPGTIAKFGA